MLPDENDDVEYIEHSFTDEENDDLLLDDFNNPLKSRFLVYEEE